MYGLTTFTHYGNNMVRHSVLIPKKCWMQKDGSKVVICDSASSRRPLV